MAIELTQLCENIVRGNHHLTHVLSPCVNRVSRQMQRPAKKGQCIALCERALCGMQHLVSVLLS